ncbi:anti-adapter protein IraM [Citrobacter koseri]|nr:anti-adapter protein IraM [Citrobacter koseri]
MEWSVENNLVCPTTGTAFALTSGAENLKFILWYKGDYFLRTGSVISPEDSGVLANGKKKKHQNPARFPLQQCVMGLFS